MTIGNKVQFSIVAIVYKLLLVSHFSMTSQIDNKRIAKNTMFLYLRTIVSLCIKLYTSRLILEYLGIEDYGIYSVVASFVAMFSLFSDSLTTTIQRFLTFSLGKGEYEKVRIYFSASIIVLLAISSIVVFFAELFGTYYIYEKLVIPEGRISTAYFVFQVSLVTFIVEILSIPYNAILSANENFKIYAYFDITSSLLILTLVISLQFVSFDKLKYYALGLMLIAIIIRYLYQSYCRKKYSEAKFLLITDRQVYKELLSFSSLTFLGQAGVVIGEGGINLVMNAFFGVAINATRGISTQVSNAVGGFIRSFTTALNPQITKAYAENQFERFEMLVFNSSKFSFLLFMLFMIPVFANIEFLLNIWLTKLPPYITTFVRIMLIQSQIHILFNAATAAIYATGRIKTYQIVTFTLLISNILFIYILYYCGRPAYDGLILQCITTSLQLIIYLYILKKNTEISITKFIYKVIMPCFTIFLICLTVSLYIELYTITYISVMSSILVCLVTSYLLGLNSSQKHQIIVLIKNKL